MSRRIGYKPGERDRSRERARGAPKGGDPWFRPAQRGDADKAYVSKGRRYDPSPLICQCDREGGVSEGRCMKCGKSTKDAAAWDQSRRDARRRRAGQHYKPR